MLRVRAELAHSDLEAIGADAIRQALLEQSLDQVPAIRTININRILARRGALDSYRRTRRPPPAAGICPMWPRQRRNWTALISSRDWSSKTAPDRGPQRPLVAWRSGGFLAFFVAGHIANDHNLAGCALPAVGLPAYAQFDNDMIFQGTPRYPEALGRVIRLCLSVRVPAGDGLPGDDRELQRLVANPGVVALRTRRPGAVAAAFESACGGIEQTPTSTDGNGSRPTGFSGELGVGPEEAAAWLVDFPEAKQWQQ